MLWKAAMQPNAPTAHPSHYLLAERLVVGLPAIAASGKSRPRGLKRGQCASRSHNAQSWGCPEWDCSEHGCEAECATMTAVISTFMTGTVTAGFMRAYGDQQVHGCDSYLNPPQQCGTYPHPQTNTSWGAVPSFFTGWGVRASERVSEMSENVSGNE